MIESTIPIPIIPLRLDDRALREVLNARSRQNIAALAIAECTELTDNDCEEGDDDSERESEVRQPIVQPKTIHLEAQTHTVMIDTTQKGGDRVYYQSEDHPWFEEPSLRNLLEAESPTLATRSEKKQVFNNQQTMLSDQNAKKNKLMEETKTTFDLIESLAREELARELELHQ